MSDKRVVLVDGVSGFWGRRVANQLLTQPELRLIGLDDQPPEPEIPGLDFIQANIQNPLLVDLLKEERVETVCHLAFADSLRPNEDAFEANVMGTMKLLGACAGAGVCKVTLPSTTLVYGAHPINSAFLREEQPLNGSKGYGYIRDLSEIEAFCNGFRHQTPQVAVTILRFAHIIGPKADTPMTRFLREEEALVLLGFDPMMQVIHEDDVVRALIHATLHAGPGVFNLAAEGNLPLWKLMGLAGKLPIPLFHPLAYLVVSLLGPRCAPIDLDYLRYPCVGDLTKMRQELQFVPQYTAEEALREFASQQRIRRYLPESLARAMEEERLRDTIERRHRARQPATAADSVTATDSGVAARRSRRNSRSPEPATSVAAAAVMIELNEEDQHD